MHQQLHSSTRTQAPRPPHQPPHVTMFVALHSADARLVSGRTGIPAEVILAQSALESNWGRKVVGNAYFGIKGKSPNGQSTTFSTHEVKEGSNVTEVDEFRAYASYREAADDYATLIKQNYTAAFAYRTDPARFAEMVARLGYATDPLYASKLKSIIRQHVEPLLN